MVNGGDKMDTLKALRKEKAAARAAGLKLRAHVIGLVIEKIKENKEYYIDDGETVKDAEYRAVKAVFHDFNMGMASGIVCEVIYDHDCKKIFLKNYDEITERIKEIEEENGCKLDDKNALPLHTFYVWVFYEDIFSRLEDAE